MHELDIFKSWWQFFQTALIPSKFVNTTLFLLKTIMNKPKYLYKSEEEFKVYSFNSEGIRGTIKKMVIFSYTGEQNIYNLGFGDYDVETKTINDETITNNGDSLKVLATVASTVYAFTEKYPKALVFATESNNVRTRLYRMGITNNLEEIKDDFEVFGLSVETNLWEEFISGEDYEAFIVKRKKL